MKKDGTVRRPCPHNGKATGISVDMFGETLHLRSLCDGCEADNAAEEAEQERRRRESLWTRAVTPKQRDWSFDTFVDGVAARSVAMGYAMNWLRDYRNGNRQNLFIHGEVGRGKTGLAVSIARELVFVDGIACYVVNWRNLLAEIQSGFGRRDDESAEERLENYFRIPVLAVDDVGAEMPTDWRRDQLATLVEHRYGHDLPMIVTTNYRQGDLIRRLGHDDRVVGERIVSRLMEGAVSLEIQGVDRRVV